MRRDHHQDRPPTFEIADESKITFRSLSQMGLSTNVLADVLVRPTILEEVETNLVTVDLPSGKADQLRTHPVE